MRKIFFILFLVFTNLSLPLSHIEAKEVRVAFGISIPPYVMSDKNKGMEYDIIKEALEHKGYVMKPVYMPFVEVMDVFVEGRADAIATLKKTVGIEGYYSDVAIRYHNMAISLKEKNQEVDTIKDLQNKKVVAFQLATNYLGAEFAEMAKNNTKYREKSDQKKQAMLLFKGKVDVVISDRNIFQYYRKQVIEEGYVPPAETYHNIFAANDYHVAFKDLEVRKDFNAGLKHLRESGRYKEIMDYYLH